MFGMPLKQWIAGLVGFGYMGAVIELIAFPFTFGMGGVAGVAIFLCIHWWVTGTKGE